MAVIKFAVQGVVTFCVAYAVGYVVVMAGFSVALSMVEAFH